MADYYSILKKTVSGLPANNAEARKRVYTKARIAIDRQLRGISPPPSEEKIAAQMNLLEDAIDQLEYEYGSVETADAQNSATGAAIHSGKQQAEAAPIVHSAAQRASNGRPGNGRPGPRMTDQPASVSPFPNRQQRVAAAYNLPEDSAGVHNSTTTRNAGRQGNEYRYSEPTARRGGKARTIRILTTLAILLCLAAGGYAAWLYKAPIMAALGVDRESPAVSGTDPVIAEDGDTEDSNAAEKEEARLGRDGETRTAGQSGESDTATGQEGESSQSQSDQTRIVRPAEEEGAPEVSTEPLITGQEDSARTNENRQTALPTIGQKAFLYEEGIGDSAASRDNAAIVWTLEMEAPADNLPREPVIKGELEVPGRGMTLDITVKRNVDGALSASHIIELLFNTPPDFSGGNIETLARFVLKANEQARGEPLVAVPVKIDSGYFMIALNNLEQARESNKRLLLESNWIDIPLGYASGRRALVALEKGETGSQIFEKAFADWENR
jgi:hypothetical protein